MYYYIVNPSSGSRSFETIQPRLKAKLRQLGIDGEFAKTLDKGDASKIARAALKQGARTVVVVGGDRTVNEVITAVNDSGKSSTCVGIIPIGHTNTLASLLKIRDWQHACELLASRRLRSFRLMHVNDHSFIHTCTLTPKNAASKEALCEIDGTYRLKTIVSSCTVSNDKLHDAKLDNKLLIQLEGKDLKQKPGWKLRLSKPNHGKLISQLHARVATMEFPSAYTANIDGRQTKGTHFRFRLSEKPLHVITAKYN